MGADVLYSPDVVERLFLALIPDMRERREPIRNYLWVGEEVQLCAVGTEHPHEALVLSSLKVKE